MRTKGLTISRWTGLWLLAAASFLAGCSAETHPGDGREATASIDVLPSFLHNAPDDVRATYRLAARHADMLEWIPCTCGCGSIGHRSNRDCFIAERRPDGPVVWDSHSVGCDVCLNIAVDAARMAESGMPVSEIRKAIDTKYGSFGPPTPTPAPPVY
ncbi:PCYCGC motif-containing (lipo)protein [Hydrogenibacillus schlegelii]|uniref:PCYCGC motif-containing (lipo)protein n=1 Tax=Hydrogenibacillus schlegelii TaxID=1484 RepID=UPI0008366607|nr:PCYCGC motif-containing (lipo)protein [Hydrogenibacillus schlegelii]